MLRLAYVQILCTVISNDTNNNYYSSKVLSKKLLNSVM